MSHKIETSAVSAVSIGIGLVGVGSIITAIIGPRLPVIKNLDAIALKALRITTGITGTAELALALAGLGYSISKYGNGSKRSVENKSSSQPVQPDQLRVSEEEVGVQFAQSSVSEKKSVSQSGQSERSGEETGSEPSQPSVTVKGGVLPRRLFVSDDETPESSSSGSEGAVVQAADQKRVDQEKQKALASAITDRDVTTVRNLLKSGEVDVNGLMPNSIRPRRLIVSAVQSRNVELVQALLSQKGIDLSRNDGKSLYYLAGNSTGIKEALLRAGAPWNGSEGRLLFKWIVREDRSDLLACLLNAGFRVNENFGKPEAPHYPLRHAFVLRKVSTFNALVKAGADLECLRESAPEGCEDLHAWALVDLGVKEQEVIEEGSVTSTSSSETEEIPEDESPSTESSSSETEEIVEDENTEEVSEGESPAANSSSRTTEELSEDESSATSSPSSVVEGTDEEWVIDLDGQRQLLKAVKDGNARRVRELIAQGNVDANDSTLPYPSGKHGSVPLLFYSIAKGDEAMVSALLSQENLNFSPVSWTTPLRLAGGQENFDVVAVLLQDNRTDATGEVAVFKRVVNAERLDLIRRLVDRGFEINARFGEHSLTTPIWYAFEQGRLIVFETLVELGAECESLRPLAPKGTKNLKAWARKQLKASKPVKKQRS